MPTFSETLTIHATTVAIHGQALVFIGPSGSGKSSMALQMIALGAALVADDQTVLTRDGAQLMAAAPAILQSGIEARGVGLLRSPAAPSSRVAAMVDMTAIETARLPPERFCQYLGVTTPLFHKCDAPHAAAAYCLFLRHGFFEP